MYTRDSSVHYSSLVLHDRSHKISQASQDVRMMTYIAVRTSRDRKQRFIRRICLDVFTSREQYIHKEFIITT